MFGRTIFDDLNDFRRNFDQVFENFYNSTRRVGSGERSSEWAFTPAVETGWTDDYLNLRVVLRGVSQHDLNITVQGDQLIIQGERKLPEGFGKEGTSYTHLSYCKFERVPDLPGGLDMEKLQASLRRRAGHPRPGRRGREAESDRHFRGGAGDPQDRRCVAGGSDDSRGGSAAPFF
jgi:HSP20 family protein